MKRFAMITLAAFGALLATAPVALAQNCTMTAPNCNCSSQLIDVTAYGNVTVPNTQSCTMTDVTVTGNVTVGIGASLDVEGNSIIVGNLQANNCNQVELNLGHHRAPTTVDGNVQIGNCTGNPAFDNNEAHNQIGGDFQCHNNSGACVLEFANVGGNVEINNNNGSQSVIEGNTIGKDLQCQNNSPAPMFSGNTVGGNPDQSSEGQCFPQPGVSCILAAPSGSC
jgi:hypothetical protein